MPVLDELRTEARRLELKNAADSNAYSSTLSWLTPMHILLVGGAGCMSTIAGAATLAGRWHEHPEIAGFLALGSAVFTALHTLLGCEPYRAECEKLWAFHRALSSDYANLLTTDDPKQLQKRLEALNIRFSTVALATRAKPLRWTRRAGAPQVLDN